MSENEAYLDLLTLGFYTVQLIIGLNAEMRPLMLAC